MTRDPHRDIRRQLATEAYLWRTKARSQARPYLKVVPKARGEAPKRAIVVGYDGTAGALPALTWALAEARGRHAPLTIVRAWQSDEQLAGPGLVQSQQQLEELAYDTLPDWARDVEGVTVVLAPRAAGPGIVEQSSDATMIVVGRRQLGALQRAWLGSTSSYVVQHASCPVVVVPEIAGVASTSETANAEAGQADRRPKRGDGSKRCASLT